MASQQPPKIGLLPVLETDWTDIAVIEQAAFFHTPIAAAAFGPLRFSDENLRVRTALFSNAAGDDKTKSVRTMKAVSDSGTIVGFAAWTFFHEPQGSSPGPSRDAWGPSANIAHCEAMFGRSLAVKERLMRGPYATLRSLAILPEYQCLGIGGLLLRDGLAIADSHNLPVWLSSSPEGYNLYRRQGFHDIDINDLDLSQYGSQGSYRHINMLRPPKSEREARPPRPTALRPVQAEDLKALVEMEAAVFAKDPFTVVAFGPKSASEEAKGMRKKGLEQEFANPENCFIKAVDEETGSIVGYASWKSVKTSLDHDETRLRESKEVKKGHDDAVNSKGRIEGKSPEELQAACREALFGWSGRAKASVEEPEYATLSFILVSPSHQHRGIASLLMHHFLNEVDKRQLPTYLGSTVPGHRLYQSHGFKDVDKIEIDLEKYGGRKGDFKVHFWMRRSANIS